MYLQHWGLRAEPFDQRMGPDWFVATPVHQEALARLHYLAENRRPLGFMSGPAGSGKTTVLEAFAQRMRAAGAAVAMIGLRSRMEEEVLSAVATGLGELVNPEADARRLWRSVAGRLAALRIEQQTTLILLDDAEGGFAFGRRIVERLLTATAVPPRHTVVLSGVEGDVRAFGRELLERADLRIDVPPLAGPETADYVLQRLTLAGASRAIFEFAGLEEIARLSGGIPRRINQLAQLCLVAGAASGAETIEASLVSGVFEEMQPFAGPLSSRHPAAHPAGWGVQAGEGD